MKPNSATHPALVQKAKSEALNLMIRRAALTIDQYGRISALANRAGVCVNTINLAIRKGRCSAGLACALEMAVGRDVLQKENLCPEKYGI